MKIVIVLIILVVLLVGLSFKKSKPYTHDEWDETCKKDFKKYGPVPDNTDEHESN
ncbi:hypothetical protein [Maribacter sp. ACAM166]|uniref:hypothetical protein n=1 Tax=Maribacter sp. ACAM166 TaxID=2508996 RepID=UPI0014857C94|nr:hypothetical protein [Maribacter sp. ACAM166]